MAIDDLKPHIDRSSKLVDDWHRVYLTWLAIGNAAGLAGVAQRLIAAPANSGWLIPSAWFFLLGLVAAGFAARWWNHYFLALSVHFEQMSNGKAEDPFSNRKMALAEAATVTTAAAFGAGVLLPLIGLTLLACNVRIVLAS